VSSPRPLEEEIADELETFLRESFQIPPDDAWFTRDVDLWEEGYVDSKGVVEVIAFLEETFGVTIPDEVLFAPEFTRVNGIAQLVAKLRQG
jgi:acyl carrier protein